MAKLTYERLREVLIYDPNSGEFTWRINVSLKARAGNLAGCVDKAGSRIFLKIDKVSYLGHRLAWFYMNGSWPRCQIDHKNLNSMDNRYENLREASSVENTRNQGVKAVSKSGLKGAFWSEKFKHYFSTIRIGGGKRLRLGVFPTALEAHEAYCAAAKKYHGEFANFGSRQ